MDISSRDVQGNSSTDKQEQSFLKLVLWIVGLSFLMLFCLAKLPLWLQSVGRLTYPLRICSCPSELTEDRHRRNEEAIMLAPIETASGNTQNRDQGL